MTLAGDIELLLVDQSVLDRLTEELDDDKAYTEVFVTKFIQVLPARIGSLPASPHHRRPGRRHQHTPKPQNVQPHGWSGAARWTGDGPGS